MMTEMDEQPNGEATGTVTVKDTAAAYGNEFPAAAATPYVLGLAEVACHRAVSDGLAPGQITVGVTAEIEHMAPSPIGTVLTARAALVQRDGKWLTFNVEVSDGDAVVARVRHRRVITDRSKIAQRLASK